MISFVIPTYNVEKTIDLVIKSIVNTLSDVGEDWEIVIVDNYSTDDTLTRLYRWKRELKHKLRIYRLRSSRGKARDFGARVAKGKIIVPLDGDMVLIKEAFLWTLYLYNCWVRSTSY